jgi:hypothetical protein
LSLPVHAATTRFPSVLFFPSGQQLLTFFVIYIKEKELIV